jgi:hypothetical protein
MGVFKESSALRVEQDCSIAHENIISLLWARAESFGRRAFSMRKRLLRRTTQSQPQITDTRILLRTLDHSMPVA